MDNNPFFGGGNHTTGQPLWPAKAQEARDRKREIGIKLRYRNRLCLDASSLADPEKKVAVHETFWILIRLNH